ncbi:MAG: hypothetical protein IMW91_08115 [Firmicutes bacterium]|nr:hypothetical protein [Bacillota bacterium]
MGSQNGMTAEHPKAGTAEPWHCPSRGAVLRDLVLSVSDEEEDETFTGGERRSFG